MRPVREIYRRLDVIQRKRFFRVALSVVVLLSFVGTIIPLTLKSRDLLVQRVALYEVLAGGSLATGDHVATTFAETGTVEAGGRVYGDESFIRRAPIYFDEQGVLVGAARLTVDLLVDQRPAGVPDFLLEDPVTVVFLGVISLALLLLVIWVNLTLAAIVTASVTSSLAFVASLLGSEAMAIAIMGMGLLTFTFIVLTRATLILFAAPHQSLAVAHTVVKEATRNRLSLVFVVLILLLLPLIPIFIEADQPLRFRIQTFISWSLGITYALAALMTLFLSCSTVAFEIRERQIWQLMTKPLTRFNYVLGKWLGIISVNLVLLLVAGVSIFVYTQYMSRLPVEAGLPGMLDRIAVRDEVLTARTGSFPNYEPLTLVQLHVRVQQKIDIDEELRRRDENDEISNAAKNEMAREMQEEHLNKQRTIAPGGGSSTYVFEGLGGVKGLQSTLTLRYRFHILRDDEHTQFPVAFVFNGDVENAVHRTYIPTVTHVIPVGSDLVHDDGTMEVTIYNLHQPPPGDLRGALNFEETDFEMLYRAGSFELNFMRAVVMTWVKLTFLAILGIATSTLLSFPVSCLLTASIFLAGTLSPFLALSLNEFYPPPTSQVSWTNIPQVIYWAVMSVIRAIAQALVFMLGRFGSYRPTQMLVEGRLIGWSAIGGGLFWLGVVWSGLCMCFGYLVLRRRQLAIYSGSA